MKRKIQNLVTRNQNLIEENLRLKKEIKLVKSPKHRKSVATAEFKKYFEIEISNDIPDYNNLALMNDHSVYPTENEVLIKRGSLLFIKKFETKNKNYFCQIYLISNSF